MSESVRGLFVTGTDTGVGKTLVTAGLVRWLRRQGIDAVPMKPVQTGANRTAGGLVSPDLEFALTAAGMKADQGEIKSMSPYLFLPACSPHLAGRLAKNYAQISVIKNNAERLLERHKMVVLEGAGGVLAPLNEKETMLDLMQAMGLPVILVARYGLGTISHSLLSIQAIRSAGLHLVGIVFNRTAFPQLEDRPVEDDNPTFISGFGKTLILGKLRYFQNQGDNDTRMWQEFEADMKGLNEIKLALQI